MKRRLGLGNLLLSGLVLITLTSCQEEEFYQKDSYETFVDIYERENPNLGDEDDLGGNGGTGDGGITNGGTDGNSDNDVADGGDNGDNGDIGDNGDDGGTDDDSNGGGSDPEVVAKSESFTQSSEKTKLDIVWVIDNSGSMADEQAALAYNFDVFIKDFIQKDVDFKMAITTTDTEGSNAGKAVNGSMTALTSSKAKSNENKFLNDFAEMVQVGTRGSGTEKGLYGAASFVNRNDSFLRDDAFVVVVILSDEEDQSSREVSYYTDYLKGQKASASMVKTYSIVNMSGVSSNNRYIADGYARYALASEQTGGYTSDINSDFYNTLTKMGNSIANLSESFALSGNPIADSIEVYVDGNQVSVGWEYDSSARTVKFMDGHVPSAGAEVQINYNQLL